MWLQRIWVPGFVTSTQRGMSRTKIHPSTLTLVTSVSFRTSLIQTRQSRVDTPGQIPRKPTQNSSTLVTLSVICTSLIHWSSSTMHGFDAPGWVSSLSHNVMQQLLEVVLGQTWSKLHGSYRSGKTGKSQGIWVVSESWENIFFRKSQGKWKIGGTRCQIFSLKCIKFDFRWGSAPDPAGGAYSAPRPPGCA